MQIVKYACYIFGIRIDNFLENGEYKRLEQFQQDKLNKTKMFAQILHTQQQHHHHHRQHQQQQQTKPRLSLKMLLIYGISIRIFARLLACLFLSWDSIMMMNHLSFSDSAMLCWWCAVERSFFGVICFSLRLFFSFVRFVLAVVHIGFVGVYGCHSEWVNSIFAFGWIFAKSFVRSFFHSFGLFFRIFCVWKRNLYFILLVFWLSFELTGWLVGWIWVAEDVQIKLYTLSSHTKLQCMLYDLRDFEFCVFTLFSFLLLWDCCCAFPFS